VKLRLYILAILIVAGTTPALAQRTHPGGGPPAGAGAAGASNSHGSATSGADGNSASASHMDTMHSSPSDVLSHNTAIAGKIKTLTGEDATSACDGFKNLGQCVAAAHVAKNLDIPGGFNALKAKTTGTGAVSLGKAIELLAPSANSKSEAKRANKQAQQDLNESNS
jgi:hypothetical protein